MHRIKNVLISVSDKSNLNQLVKPLLVSSSAKIYSTGGTLDYLSQEFKSSFADRILSVEDKTQFPEILQGRVKTLHPQIFGGVLATTCTSDQQDIVNHKIDRFDILAVNLYPFLEKPEIENIDIGGASLLRAAAKNYLHTSILSSPEQYSLFLDHLKNQDNLSPDEINQYRLSLAYQAWQVITQHDVAIHNYLAKKSNNQDWLVKIYQKERDLKYGLNPHQGNSKIYTPLDQEFPYHILHGKPGYINFLDFHYGWQVVNRVNTELPVAVSYKHNSPAGAAIGNNTLHAIKKARYCDAKSSFGDILIVKGDINLETARKISSWVCDGILASSFTPTAVEYLINKRKKMTLLVPTQAEYQKPDHLEIREIGNFLLTQNSNMYTSPNSKSNLQLAETVLQYTQSNSVALAYQGQVIGIGAGQQNRVDCVKLAGEKAQNWWYRNFSPRLKREMAIWEMEHPDFTTPEMINQMYAILSQPGWEDNQCPKMDHISLASDGFFPFPDNLEVAAEYGVKYISQPGGSIRDKSIQETAEKLGMEMVITGKRLFLH